MSSAQTAAPHRPRVFHGWLIVAIAFCSQFITAGTGGYTFGQFITPLSQSFRWSVGLVSSMSFTRAITSMFVAPLVGWLTDRMGSRTVMVAGTLIAGGAFVLASLVAEPIVFYIIFSVVVSIGYNMVGGVPVQAVVTRWFRRQRGMALSLASTGISVGGIVMVPLTQVLLDSAGWRFTLGAIGAGVLIVMLPPVLLYMRDYPEQMGLHPDGLQSEPTAETGASARPGPATARIDERVWTTREILTAPNFWKQAIGYMFAFGMLQVTLIYQFPFIVNHGFDNGTAALIVSGYATCAAISRFGWGYLADRLPVQFVAVASIWLAAIGVAFLIFGTDLTAIWLYAIIGGSGISGLAALQSMVTAESFGRRSFGTVAGLLNPMNQLTAAIAVPFTGFMYDATGAYSLALAIVSLLAVAASLSLLAMPRTIKA
jgi:sugar phosphate permease